jgi:hypothetical protein
MRMATKWLCASSCSRALPSHLVRAFSHPHPVTNQLFSNPRAAPVTAVLALGAFTPPTRMASQLPGLIPDDSCSLPPPFPSSPFHFVTNILHITYRVPLDALRPRLSSAPSYQDICRSLVVSSLHLPSPLVPPQPPQPLQHFRTHS